MCMRLLFVVTLALAGSGCGLLPSGGEGNGGGGLLGGADNGPCPDYSGIGEVGSWSEYEYRGDTVGTWRTEVVASADAGDSATIELQQDSDFHVAASDYSSDTTTILIYRCDDDGAWLVSGEQTTDYVVAGTAGSSTSTWYYEQPALSLPANLEVGDYWTFEGTLVNTTDDIESSTEVSNTYSAQRIDEVEVAGQTWTALEIVLDAQTPYWADKDQGYLEGTSGELIDFGD